MTLEFFDERETILIHYSDQYTNSISYDAITVSSRVGLYRGLLKDDSDELISSFNAINGQWLLDIVKESGKPKTVNTEKQIKEKQGIIAAYKFIAALLLKSDITWAPLSIGEMLRVTGNVGLEIKENDFSARLHNKRKGALCDDILFVGFKGNEMYLLPLEVKSREKGSDFTKAVAQAKELAEHMKRLLAPATFKGQIYRSLFIQQIMSQIEKFELYNVFPTDYFSAIKQTREVLQQGHYTVKELSNYPQGIALAINNSVESARLDCNFDKEEGILKLRLPDGLKATLQKQSIHTLSEKLADNSLYPELAPFLLLNTTSMQISAGAKKEEKPPVTIDDTPENEGESNVLDSNPIVRFSYPSEYDYFMEKLLMALGHDLNKEDILALAEADIKGFGDFENEDVLTFYRIKDYLMRDDSKSNTPIELDDNSSLKLCDLNIPQDYCALINALKKHFGGSVTVEKLVNITETELLELNGFGIGKLRKFNELIALLQNEDFIDKNTFKKADIATGSIKLKDLNIAQEYVALANLIKRNFGEDCTVAEVLSITELKLLSIGGFGKGKIIKFNDFCNLLHSKAFSIKSSNTSIKLIDDFDMPLSVLERHLINSLDSYLSTEKERGKAVFTRRLGISCEIETLEEIAKDFDITRERIRQIETICKKNFIAQLPVSQNVIWAITKSSLSELRSPIFPELRARFNEVKGFYSFLEICCDLNENEIKRITSPSLNKSVFHEFWAYHKSPAEVESLSWYLHENLNVELVVAENQIVIWGNEGNCRIEGWDG